MSFVEKEPKPHVYVKDPINWGEVLIGLLTFSPFIIWFVVWLWKHL